MVALTPQQKEEVFNFIRSNFTDFLHFNELVASPLRRMIQDSDSFEYTYVTSARLVERYFDLRQFQLPQQRSILSDITMIMKACLVLLFSHQPQAQRVMFPSLQELVHFYPNFRECSGEELELLLRFRNIMRIAIMLIPARQNKHMLLKIAGRLEGAHRDYIMGGGQRKEVDRRVYIYHHESGLPEKKRPKHGSQVQSYCMEIACSAQKRAASRSWLDIFNMSKMARNERSNSILSKNQQQLLPNCISPLDSLSSTSSDSTDFDLQRLDSSSSCVITDMEVSDVLFHDTLIQELDNPDIELLAAGERGYSLDTEFKSTCSALGSTVTTSAT